MSGLNEAQFPDFASFLRATRAARSRPLLASRQTTRAEVQPKTGQLQVGSVVLAQMRKVPKAWSPGVIEELHPLGYLVAMQHPHRPNKLHTVFRPEELRSLE